MLSARFVVSGAPWYGDFWNTVADIASGKNSWPVCTELPPANTFMWMCTAGPGYQPG